MGLRFSRMPILLCVCLALGAWRQVPAAESPKAQEPATIPAPAPPVASPTVTMPVLPVRMEQTAPPVRATAEQAEQVQRLIRRLTTPGWKDAETALLHFGRPAVPFLIEALGAGPGYPLQAYPLQAPGRATRERPISDVAYEVLLNLFQNHSTYTGALPGLSRQAWQDFWAQNGAGIQIGQP